MIQIQHRFFDLKIEYKQNKNLYLRIKGNSLIVTAPFYLSREEIIRFIQSKEAWIIKKIEESETKTKTSRLKISDTISYLGKWYRFTIYKGPKKIQILDDEIIIHCKSGDIEEALTLFYNQESLKRIIDKYEEKYLTILKEYHYDKIPEIKFKMLKGSWGICYARKNLITLNKRLIHYNEKCIEAVYWHEILHFILPNHSKRFHEVLEYHMPDYKNRHQEIY